MKPRLSALLQRDLEVDPVIRGVTADSRQVRQGYLFAALPGGQADGKAYVGAALAQGAAAVLAADDLPGLSAPVVQVHDPRRAYALAAAAFWNRQPETCVAVTGTNGKTSVAGFCRQIFAALGRASASMGTLGVRAGEVQLTPPGLTTPDAGDVARLLCELATGGVTHLALEASSHGLDQRRLDGVRLTAGAFLNLTQDHLDYHGDMARYRAAKLRLFDTLLPRGATAVLNADSDAYPAFAATAVSQGLTVLSVGAAGQSIRVLAREADLSGQRLAVRAFGRRYDVDLPLAGAFQASNALVAAGLCIAAGEAPEAVFAALANLEGAPGRLQRVGASAKG
ncbi:MAG: UDP-N-acetylmuramoyl-L-alanyl-D-glutamate--2,6-diaminopimelate ligase, partial [Alphaproteobacteria bacterium]|nr:UDP-N-acetylmuramoyl-L-alanyl-D-glutamate--2,6-diaminopimelate ligase [Alphaproteobacteria bacterium]